LEGILSFLRGAEQLKNTLRTSRTSSGRHESTAEHTWRLCLTILLFEDQYPDIDILMKGSALDSSSKINMSQEQT
jgi:putative hydrolase of HD superfamily